MTNIYPNHAHAFCNDSLSVEQALILDHVAMLLQLLIRDPDLQDAGNGMVKSRDTVPGSIAC